MVNGVSKSIVLPTVGEPCLRRSMNSVQESQDGRRIGNIKQRSSKISIVNSIQKGEIFYFLRLRIRIWISTVFEPLKRTRTNVYKNCTISELSCLCTRFLIQNSSTHAYAHMSKQIHLSNLTLFVLGGGHNQPYGL